MPAAAPNFELPFGVVSGQTRPRSDRPVKNGRWYVIRPGVMAKVGWGDLSFADMETIAGDLRVDEVFVVLPERPVGGQHPPTHPQGQPDLSRGAWCWYDRPDDPPGPTLQVLADSALYAVMDRQLRFVDCAGMANRLGAVWLHRGHRYSAAGHPISTGKVRLMAIRPADLLHQLLGLYGRPT